MDVYPLIFEPIFKPKIWGGRTLERTLHKALPPDEPIGESWEVSDLEEDQSVVACGPAKGQTVGQLVKCWGTALYGRSGLFEGRFPLLIKFLDARSALSVQVHPSQAVADRLGGRVRVKHEAWYVIDAEPDGYIYRGVKPGVDAAGLREAIDRQVVESVLSHIPVRRGDCYYLPSGTIHALGAGVTVAEVQTPSDITYRVYDWNRVDATTGRARDLHLEQALPCISYDPVPARYEVRRHVASVWTQVTSLVRCESFVMERVRMVEGVEQALPYAEMVIWIVLEGSGEVSCAGSADPVRFSAGDTVVLPAGLNEGRVLTKEVCLWLEVSIPIASSLAGFDRPPPEPHGAPVPRSPFVQIDVPKKT